MSTSDTWDHRIKQYYLTILRDINTNTRQFRRASDHLAALLCLEALSKLPSKPKSIQTPVGHSDGIQIEQDIMILPVYRAGQALVQPFINVVPDVQVGSLLIQRDEKTALPHLFYNKLPTPLPRQAVILDPMLATAGTAVMAVQIMKEAGYAPDKLYFMGVIAAQEGYNRLAAEIPAANITVAAIDPHLNSLKYIDPGLGDYGDRYFGT